MADTQRLYRIPEEGIIAGVCAGLGDYFDIDVTLVRVVFVVMTFASAGFGILLYVLLAILTPTRGSAAANQAGGSKDVDDIKESLQEIGDDLQEAAADVKRSVSANKNRLRNYLGAGLVAFGLWLLASQFMPELIEIRWNYIWPVLLIALGLMILSRRK